MTYVDLVNKFWEKDFEFNFSDKEIALYFYLLNVCNRLTWKNPFGQSNAMMIAKFGWGKTSFDSAKKRLKDAGLIDFKAGDGRGNTYQYMIIGLKGKINHTQKRTLSETLSPPLSDNLSEPKPEISIDIDLDKDKGIDAKASLSGSPADSRTPTVEVAPDKEQVDYKDVVVFFNSETKGVFGEIRYPLNERRMANIRARIREHGKEAFAEMVRKAAKSDFLKGGGRTGFRATFDWLILPSNFQKVLEGNYDNRHKGADPAGQDGFIQNIAQGFARGRQERE